jgi:sirohydrochlorin cobaltochelatase
MAEKTPALILFAHGAREAEWALPFESIRRRIMTRRPGLAVELAFLEIMQPTLAEAAGKLVADGHAAITIVPVFMGQGGHLKRDLPRLVDDLRARHPGTALTLTPPIGEADAVLEAIGEWVVNAVSC